MTIASRSAARSPFRRQRPGRDLQRRGELLVRILAAVAEHERKLISARTKAALAVAKAYGTKLGGFCGYLLGEADRAAAAASKREQAARRAAKVLPAIRAAQAAGATSLRQLAARLNAEGIPAPRGGAWHATTIRQVLRHAPA